MKKKILGTLIFLGGILLITIGVVLTTESQNRLQIIPGSILIGLGIYGIRWSLTKGLKNLLGTKEN